MFIAAAHTVTCEDRHGSGGLQVCGPAAESADRHRQLLKLAVQDVCVRQHARSALTQLRAQYTPNQAFAPTVYAYRRTDDQPRTPLTVCVSVAPTGAVCNALCNRT